MNKLQYQVAGLWLAGVVGAGVLLETQHTYHPVVSDEQAVLPGISVNSPLPHLPHVEYDSQTFLLKSYYAQTGVGQPMMGTEQDFRKKRR